MLNPQRNIAIQDMHQSAKNVSINGRFNGDIGAGCWKPGKSEIPTNQWPHDEIRTHSDCSFHEADGASKIWYAYDRNLCSTCLTKNQTKLWFFVDHLFSSFWGIWRLFDIDGMGLVVINPMCFVAMMPHYMVSQCPLLISGAFLCSLQRMKPREVPHNQAAKILIRPLQSSIARKSPND